MIDLSKPFQDVISQIKLSIKCDILRDAQLLTLHIFRHMKIYGNTCKYDYIVVQK